MCGICGAFSLGSEVEPPLRAETLVAMTDAMRHRGPDDRGIYTDAHAVFGVRRLSIVDVPGGHQPFLNEHGTVAAVQNGELYNHKDIRRELERGGHKFRSHCDTEILPHLWEDLGPTLTQRLNGMFAIAIWDSQRKAGLVARDRLGVKPLYYAAVDGGTRLLFASELKALLMSGNISPDVDGEAVELFLSLGFFPGPRTILADVKKLAPGHAIVVEDGAFRIDQYWSYPDATTAAGEQRSEREWLDEFAELLDDAVRLRLMSDVPLGAMLSGGLDSTVIVALMARHMDRRVSTFSVGFAGSSTSELGAARATAKELGTDHHELELRLDDAIDLESLVWTLDEPVADLSSVGFAALSELTSRHVTVALSGQGADELLAGYGRYRQLGHLQRWRGIRHVARRVLPGASGGTAAIGRRLSVALSDDPVVAATLARSEWWDRTSDVRGKQALVDALRQRAGTSNDLIERSLRLDAQLNLVDDMLHYFDRTSMRHSLEVRVPFLDYRIVEFCAKMPSNLKLRNGETKYALRSIARELVPAATLRRPKVGFFSGAVNEWFEHQLHSVAGEYLRDSDARYRSFVDPSVVHSLLGDHSRYRDSKLLLSVLMLEIWLRTFPARLRATTEPVSQV